MKKTNENGITLIALVVTIVVLLILAGITITYVLADGGVFDTANQAATATIAGQIQDYASQIQSDVMTGCAIVNSVGEDALPEGLTHITMTSGSTAQIAKDKIQAYFPEQYFTVDETSTVGLQIDTEKGVIQSGTFKVKALKNNGKEFNVTFTDGRPEVKVDEAGE